MNFVLKAIHVHCRNQKHKNRRSRKKSIISSPEDRHSDFMSQFLLEVEDSVCWSMLWFSIEALELGTVILTTECLRGEGTPTSGLSYLIPNSHQQCVIIPGKQLLSTFPKRDTVCHTFYALSHLILTITPRSILLLSPFKGEEEVKNLPMVMCFERSRKKRAPCEGTVPSCTITGRKPWWVEAWWVQGPQFEAHFLLCKDCGISGV